MINFQISEKRRKMKFFTSKNIHGSEFRIFSCYFVAIYCFETALMNFGKWRQRGAPRFAPSSKCNEELQKKFVITLIVYQRWCHSEKTKTGITFDLDVILTFFFNVIFFEGVLVEKLKFTCFFWSAVPL